MKDVTSIDLIRARHNAGHNQEEAAAEMDLVSSSVGNFERGKVKRPHKTTRKAFAAYVKKYGGQK